MIQLIITADDYGYSEERNRAIIEAFKNSLVTRTSVLMNGTCLRKPCLPINMPIGLHINLTEGDPIIKSHKTLTDTNNKFYSRNIFIDMASRGKFLLEEIHLEIMAQLEKFRRVFQIEPNHVDGHQHVHVTPNISKIVAKVCQQNKVTRIRIPYQMLLNSEQLTESRNQFYKKINYFSQKARIIFQQFGLVSTDVFFGFDTMGYHMSLERLNDNLKTLRGYETCEWMVHPGRPGKGGCGSGVDEFSLSQARVHELQFLCNGSTKETIASHHLELIS